MSFGEAALAYFASRAIEPDLAAAVGVTEGANGLRFPCCAASGGTYYRERSLNGGPAKVKQPTGQPLALWWPLGRPETAEAVLVCEGESDALAALEPLSESGFASLATVAVPGTGLPVGRLAEQLAEVGIAEAFLAFDADDAGRRYAEKAAGALRDAGIKPISVELEDGADLADTLYRVDDRSDWINQALADAEAAAQVAAAEPLEVIAGGNGAATATGPSGVPSPCIPLREFVAIERPPLDPYLATDGGRTVLLAPETMLLFAGPSGLGKSLAAAFDLGGRVAADEPSDWIGFRARARLRVLLLSFEGSDEDTAERGRALVPEEVGERFRIWDRWRGLAVPRADDNGLRRLAAEIARHEIDVLVIDTGSAFFGGAHDCSKGIPEEAFEAIERLRDLSGRRCAVVVVVHTKKADRTGAKVDELEEIAGTFARKADAAIVMRRDGERGPRRRLVFPKTRRGPEPAAKIASLPPEGSDEPPRLALLHDLEGAGVKKAGTAPEEITKFVREQPGVVSPQAICEHFEIADSTLRERRPDLARLGITYAPRPALGGNAHGYGTAEQWTAEGGLFDD